MAAPTVAKAAATAMPGITNSKYAEAARTLPRTLRQFFCRYPPPAFLKTPPPGALASSHTYSAEPTVDTSNSDPALNSGGYRNPFLPFLHPVTGRWHNPRYSLRKQADLFKIASKHGVDNLLPYSVKSPAYKAQVKELGSRVKGTGLGEKVKGHARERQLKSKLDKRRRAMEGMPEMIREWKQRGHGRGWKKWPK